MSKFLQPPEPILPSDALYKSAFAYIMDELRNSVDAVSYKDLEKNGEKEILNIMDKDRMRFYGTAEELAENLAVFRNFSKSHQFFKVVDSIPYFNTPVVYKSLKDEDYVFKSDLFVILQNIVFHVFPEAKAPHLRSMLLIFLKSQEHRLQKKLEFVRYDSKQIDEIEKEIIEEIEKNKKTINEEKLSIRNYNTVFSMFQKLIPKEFVNRKESKYWRAELSALSEPINLSGAEVIETLHKNIRIIVQSLQTIINKRPEMFLPRSVTKKGPITMRLFEDGDQKVVMRDEITETMTSQRVCQDDEIRFYGTLNFNDMSREVAKTIEERGIEFIRTPILRAKHKAVPIRAPDGGFCILAVDAMFQLIKSIIIGGKMFQRIKKSSWDGFMEFLQPTEIFFNSTMQGSYFIGLELLKNIQTGFSLGIRKMKSIPANEVRDVKTDGFTVQDLKDELKYLGISDLFEEIEGYAQVVYEEIDRNKKEAVLRTCDMFDALEMCQIICLMNRVPHLKKFLHLRNSCGRVLTLKCSTCIKTPPKPVAPERDFESSKDQDTKSSTTTSTTTIEEDCAECLQNENSLEETKKEIKTNKNRMKKLEKKVKGYNERIEEVKGKNEENKEQIMKDLEEKENELDELKRNLAENYSVIGENDTLKLTIQQLEFTNFELKDKISSQEHLKTQAALNEHISQLELDLAAEKENHQNPTDDENSKFNLEIQEKTRQIHEFHETNIRLKAESEFKERMIQQLMDKLSSTSFK